MKIEKIKLYHVEMPLRSPFETSFGRVEKRACVLVEVLAGGLHGWGECAADRDPGYSYETTGTSWHILSDFLAPALLSADTVAVADYQATVSKVRGHPLAKAGLEMALWDLRGKIEDVSLKEMLGGERRQVEVGVSIGLQDSPQDLVEIAADYLEQGYRRVKIKIKPGRDIGDARALREAFPSLRLQVDANSAYTLETALSLLPLDELDLLMIEQPLAEDDLWDHHRLQTSFSTPLCLDESITSLRHARQAVEMGACRIINIKPGRIGGLSHAAAVHDHCRQHGIPVWCGGMLETGVGRASNLAVASLPGFTLPGDISATNRYYAEDITVESFELNPDSTIDVPSAPGLGIQVNQSVLKKYTLDETEITSLA